MFWNFGTKSLSENFFMQPILNFITYFVNTISFLVKNEMNYALGQKVAVKFKIIYIKKKVTNMPFIYLLVLAIVIST